MKKAGLDIGSTTIKCVVMDEEGKILYSQYERHYSLILEKAAQVLERLAARFPEPLAFAISGSAGMGLAEALDVPFIQEVYATRAAVTKRLPQTDVVIELGGEDAKILFLSGGMDVCMNGTCAGGTGAFIDQMATLLQVDQDELNFLAANASRKYPIASRCGVFAKTDIQPLLNQGASKENISASIFQAVVNQTIAGLAHGRPIQGNIVYLGGPLTFCSELRACFDQTIQAQGTCPKDSLYFVAMGAAMQAGGEPVLLEHLKQKVGSVRLEMSGHVLPPLFESAEAYEQFRKDHPAPVIPANPSEPVLEPVVLTLGMDAGSTTVKCAAVDQENRIRYSCYEPGGDPVQTVRHFLEGLYETFPNARILSSAATGYGEELIQAAFHADHGIVETVAHYTGAKTYDPEVDFILDIGGQDIKCFKISQGAIDQICLNEACSSGCGSFLQTFSAALGYDAPAFAQKALEGRKPVDLGSRCTVFMNSSVKQAQKDGAAVEDIAAGLAVSVVKNALHKVIRLKEGEVPGQHILVQGGTFLNDAVLRAFEKELGMGVTRPDAAGLMGAYGAAIWARVNARGASQILSREQLKDFVHTRRNTVCQGCTNHCRLTWNFFGDGHSWLAGNQCSRPVKERQQVPGKNIWQFKRDLLEQYGNVEGKGPVVGLPLVLNFYEWMPFWHTLFGQLGFSIRTSGPSSKQVYQQGQSLIPSDTVCYPAKLAHGHMVQLDKAGVDFIFYPCLSYNVQEGLSDDHYNCPVVAYYPEVAKSTWSGTPILTPYLGVHRKNDFPKKFQQFLQKELGMRVSMKAVRQAAEKAYEAYEGHLQAIRAQGQLWLDEARKEGRRVVVLAGRPYHADKEVMHGIDQYIAGTGALVLSEDALAGLVQKAPVDVLNQWSWHARLYGAAQFVADADMEDLFLVQLVSFGCGIDAITADEVRAILEEKGRLYTQLKIDETTNLGAVKIRLRSLFAWKGACA